ncbi:MAG TPA: ABC transporter permease [Chthoniobacteraceae bacterium]|nr:ABC transporter permease [Chthoniobacteraceae bacterium]
MKTPFSLFLALRYLKPKRTFVSVITLISIIGVMLGITVLILVISVMTGFERELRQKVLGFDPHILVGNPEGGGLPDWQEVMKEIAAAPRIEAAAPFVQGPVIVESKRGDGFQRLAPNIRGIDVELESKVTRIGDFIREGKLDLSGNTTVIGIDLARSLGVGVGDKVTIYSPGNVGEVLSALQKAEDDPKELENVKTLLLPAEMTVTGIFESGRFVYDSQFLLVPLYIGQELYGLQEQDTVHGISVRTVDPKQAGPIRDVMLAHVNARVTAQTWEEMNHSFFEAIAMERNVMFFLLMFIIIVAAFGIMNTLITVTVQKTREIGIMKALGATTGQIVLVFLGQGMIVGFFGNLAGLGLGMTLITYRNEFKDWLAERLGIEVFPASVYQFSRIPAEVVPYDVATICISAFVICSLAALIPAYFAARLDPVTALRQE